MARVLVVLLVVFGLLVTTSHAQSTNATVGGQITDEQGRVVLGVTVVLTNLNTGVTYEAKTNGDGIYSAPNLPPGIYRANVTKDGFKSIVKGDIDLHVQDVASINFQLQVGSVNETVTVEAGGLVINTTDASVSTVVDQTYVKNMPLNGRSFQDLILLTPGVVTTSPQSSAVTGEQGEFSVNGQRTESNYYTVDGVSANVGIDPNNATRPGTGGSLPAATALGTTQGLVSVDALEEFRVQSSTYSAEYGRNPGGQFSFVTRSGTNEWHGTAFDYLRNDVFDANDWFNDLAKLPKPALRQNDFGGTLGGPIEIPHLYNGKNKTFFFFSYEGLRLLQPQAATVQFVPDAALRASTPAPLRQVLNAFPLSNCTGVAPPSNCPPSASGFAGFIATWSNPSHIDSYSIRLDHTVSERLKVFFRFSDTPSESSIRNPIVASVVQPTAFAPRTYTTGVTSLFSANVSNDFRLNYSSNESTSSARLDSFGGAVPVDLWQLQGISSGSIPFPVVNFGFFLPGLGSNAPILNQDVLFGKQRQWNIVDTAGISFGRHQLKFGVDYRRLSPFQSSGSPNVSYFFFSQSSVQANSVDIGEAGSTTTAYPLYTNFAAFAEDHWRTTPRLSISMGLRWEVNPPPGSTKGKSNIPFTTQGDSLASLTLAPQGTPLWKTSWYNFAPRLGVAYLLRSKSGSETVVRGGVGVFFDRGQQLGSAGYAGVGFSAFSLFGGFFGSPASFPIPPAQASPVIVSPPVAPFNSASVISFSPHLQLPFTLQWNSTIEQALGKAQKFTMSYVGANGRRLLETNQTSVTPFNPNFGTVLFIRNGLTSDYHALQMQYQRRFSHGLTALASYTWSHSIDFGSLNTAFRSVRGNSDFDVRHNFSAAASYDLPSHFQSQFARALLNHWGLDDRFTGRSGFPVTLAGPFFVDSATGHQGNAGLDLVPGIPLYVYGSQYPGGRAINGNAFRPPAGCSPGSCPSAPAALGDAPRNFARGFGAWQMDVAIRRDFPIYERLKLQFRAEAFNIFNHPNFGLINTSLGTAQFGQATATLDQSLKTMSPLYQMGGPRSLQLSLKFVF